ncbi:FtsB family cell division protein [Tenacibaculum agarivorans]|uniref:FtsB family cell division protein n=1 Tax=Tenacibaculum agarivorans TaxID=1908389 RepID=UPI00094B7A5A|nr:septum formation initiator family protein [Tenacibaculum agarivorans]
MKLKKNFKFLGISIGATYALILTVFVVWMLFFDDNSYRRHKDFDKDIKELETWIDYHKKKIAEDKETIKKLKDSLELERFAREKYLMKRKDEDVYIIEFDTVKK